MIVVVTLLPTVRDAAVDRPSEESAVDCIAEDGAHCRVPLLETWAVRFEAMAPARRFQLRKAAASHVQ
jgi:hypothetical protein